MGSEMDSYEGTANILAIATANPPNEYLQSEFADMYFRVTNTDHMTELKQKFKTACAISGTRKRHMYLTEEILRKSLKKSPSNVMEVPMSTQMEIEMREVPLLGTEAARKAIEEWGRPASDITHLVFATSSCPTIPTVDCRLVKLLGLSRTVHRHFLFGQACSGASAALRLADALARTDPAARVLVVCSENMTVKFTPPEESFTKLVGHAIFGDGAAALVVGRSPLPSETPLFRLLSAAQTLVPDSEPFLSATLEDSGRIAYAMSTEVPACIEANVERAIAGALAPFLEKARLGSEVFYVVHPGMSMVLDAVEAKLGLGPEKLKASRRVLGEYGNMWSATALFILDEVRRKSVADGKSTTGDGLDWGIMVTFGPGFTIDTMVLRSVSI